MMLRRDDAFILRTQPIGEADLIVSFLAQEHGCVRGVAKAGRKSRKRFGGNLEPMTHVIAVWDEKSGRELHRLDRLEGRHSYARMQSEPLCQAVCAVFSELTEAFGREGGSDDREFRLLGAVLDALEAGTPPMVALRYFEFWTLRLHGMIADLRRCAHCDSVMPVPGSRLIGIHDGARCSNCQTHAVDPGRTLSSRDCAWLDRLHRDKPLDLKTMDPAARAGGEIARLFHAQLENFAERKFRSYRHVHALALTTEASS